MPTPSPSSLPPFPELHAAWERFFTKLPGCHWAGSCMEQLLTLTLFAFALPLRPQAEASGVALRLSAGQTRNFACLWPRLERHLVGDK